jgi:hypothetical protein
MTPIIRTAVRTMLAGLTLLLCFGPNGIHVVAQNSGVLSKRPPVIRIFDSDKNQSTISAPFFDPQNNDLRAMAGLDPDHPPPEIRLHRVEYTYPGKIQSRPQAVLFVFLPLDKYKNAPNFSVTADGMILQEGQATFDELCCEKVNGHTYTQQQIIVPVPIDIFARITQAKKVELKLTSKSGKYSFKLNDYQKKCLAALANTIK